ncbi:MAG TPA: hypothetical protein VLF40_00300 [Candidatus Saccharimonadales bacterium]|nr:hypothetical protein [Candidatus Saccharimonadales bacterium]
MSKKPGFVPLPEVPEHTEHISLENLGLPIGFDEERLLVNVGAMERIRRAIGLGDIVVTAAYLNDSMPAVDGVSESGVATMAKASFADLFQRPPGRAALENEDWVKNSDGLIDRLAAELTASFIPRDAVLALDLRERDERFRRAGKGVLDASLQAQFLSGSIKDGLYDANRKASITPYSLVATLVAHGGVTSVLAVFDYAVTDTVNAELLISGNLLTRAALLLAVMSDALPSVRESHPDVTFKEFWLHLRHSLIAGATLDRYLMGQTALATSGKLIKAQK